jgi:alkanesulfonate monooxygenase SsuD/methylene tetrahydromethanopterin reductase-like flavin-dependent oxidoreductase (luciferase family)
VKLGILVEAEEGLDWEEWRTLYTAAERLGFDSVSLADHLESPWSPARHGIDPWVALSVAAAETQRIRLGPLVSPITFRHPAIVARMAEAIDMLRPGRFVLGLGVGWSADEHARCGLPFPPLTERVRLLEDGIKRVRRMLGERRIPLLIGAGGPRLTLPLVARYADEWNMTTASVELYRARGRRLAELCQAVGRDPAAIRRSVAVGLLIGRDASDVLDRSRRMRTFIPPFAEVETNQVATAARQMGWVAGTPMDIVDQLRSLADAGVDSAMLGIFDRRDIAALELVASEVMPAIA